MEGAPTPPRPSGPAWGSRAASAAMAKAITEALVLSDIADWSPDAGPGVLLEELIG